MEVFLIIQLHAEYSVFTYKLLGGKKMMLRDKLKKNILKINTLYKTNFPWLQTLCNLSTGNNFICLSQESFTKIQVTLSNIWVLLVFYSIDNTDITIRCQVTGNICFITFITLAVYFCWMEKQYRVIMCIV